MRCLALADALRDLGRSSVFLSSPEGGALAETVAARGHDQRMLDVSPASEAADAELSLHWLASMEGCDGMVVDHYQLGLAWEQAVGASGIPVTAIDDLGRTHDCDILLDQNIVDLSNPYLGRVPKDCRVLLGPRHALLHPDFRRLRNFAPVRSSIRKILVFFGGSDPGNETEKALHGLLAAAGGWQVDVVIGASNPHRGTLQDLCAVTQGQFHLHVQTSRMAELMAGADLAIGAGGSASWERCCLRLPAIAAVLADNQAGIAESLDRLGALRNIGKCEKLGPADYADAVMDTNDSRIGAMSEIAGTLVDGQGAARVADELSRCLESFSRSKT